MKKVLLIITIFISCLSEAQTIEQVRQELIKQNIPHYNIVLAQARLETGNFTSRLCKVNHNLFGIKHGRRYARYSDWRQSIADYKKRISSRYKGGDYYQFLIRIGYAKDKQYVSKLRKFK